MGKNNNKKKSIERLLIEEEWPSAKAFGTILPDYNLASDPLFTRERTGAGSIEYFNEPFMDYGNKWQPNIIINPNGDSPTILYNPIDNSVDDIKLDLLHHYRLYDNVYNELLDDYQQSINKSDVLWNSLIGDHFRAKYPIDSKNPYTEHWEEWDNIVSNTPDNSIYMIQGTDGSLRNLLAKDETILKSNYAPRLEAENQWLSNLKSRLHFNAIKEYLESNRLPEVIILGHKHDDGGPLDWNDLSMKEKAAYIRMGVANGYRDIDSIRLVYNEFRNGGHIYDGKTEKTQKMSRATWMLLHQSLWYQFLKSKGLNNADSLRLALFFSALDGLESNGGLSSAARLKNNYGGMLKGGKNITYDTIHDYMEDKWAMMNKRFSHALKAKNIDEFASMIGHPDNAGKGYLYYVTDKASYNPSSQEWRNALLKHMQNYTNGMRSWAGQAPIKYAATLQDLYEVNRPTVRRDSITPVFPTNEVVLPEGWRKTWGEQDEVQVEPQSSIWQLTLLVVQQPLKIIEKVLPDTVVTPQRAYNKVNPMDMLLRINDMMLPYLPAETPKFTTASEVMSQLNDAFVSSMLNRLKLDILNSHLDSENADKLKKDAEWLDFLERMNFHANGGHIYSGEEEPTQQMNNGWVIDEGYAPNVLVPVSAVAPNGKYGISGKPYEEWAKEVEAAYGAAKAAASQPKIGPMTMSKRERAIAKKKGDREAEHAKKQELQQKGVEALGILGTLARPSTWVSLPFTGIERFGEGFGTEWVNTPIDLAFPLAWRGAANTVEAAANTWRYRGLNASNASRGLLPNAEPLIARGTNGQEIHISPEELYKFLQNLEGYYFMGHGTGRTSPDPNVIFNSGLRVKNGLASNTTTPISTSNLTSWPHLNSEEVIILPGRLDLARYDSAHGYIPSDWYDASTFLWTDNPEIVGQGLFAVRKPNASFTETTVNDIPGVYTKPEAILGSYNTRTHTLRLNPLSQYSFPFNFTTGLHLEDGNAITKGSKLAKFFTANDTPAGVVSDIEALISLELLKANIGLFDRLFNKEKAELAKLARLKIMELLEDLGVAKQRVNAAAEESNTNFMDERLSNYTEEQLLNMGIDKNKPISVYTDMQDFLNRARTLLGHDLKLATLRDAVREYSLIEEKLELSNRFTIDELEALQKQSEATMEKINNAADELEKLGVSDSELQTFANLVYHRAEDRLNLMDAAALDDTGIILAPSPKDARYKWVVNHERNHVLLDAAKAFANYVKKFGKDTGFKFSNDYLNKLTELLARGTQIKDFFGLKKDLGITAAMLKYASKHYSNLSHLNNDMTEFFKGITDYEKAAKWLSYAASLGLPLEVVLNSISESNEE